MIEKEIMSRFFPMKKLPTATAQQKGERICNGRIHHYIKPEVQKARDLLESSLAKYAPEEPVTGPVLLQTIWCFPTTAKHPNGEPHASRPDTDNLVKLLKDVMTDLGYWKDDSQVCDETTVKIYADIVGIRITVKELVHDA